MNKLYSNKSHCCESTATAKLQLITASVAEQTERARHDDNCACTSCRAARAIAQAEHGEEPSVLELDANDPVVIKLIAEGMAAVRDERRRVDRRAAAWYARAALRGQSGRGWSS
jgi:hypothetical protein